MPYLLDANLSASSDLTPAHLSVTEQLFSLSTAEMVLGAGTLTMSGSMVRQFVHLFDENGSMGIYRIAACQVDQHNTCTMSLEHGICTLEDCVGPEEAELSGSMRSILTTILAWQHDVKWQLGDVDVPDTVTHYTLHAGNQIALQALFDAVALCNGAYALAYDQTTTPWTVHLRKLPTIFDCECRLSQNVAGVSIAYDESEMCTRVTSAMLEGGYYQDAQAVEKWGVIARALDIDEESALTPLEQATAYVADHASPRVAVEIDALELGKISGNPYDFFSLGKSCRVALGALSQYLTLQIVSVHWPDVYGGQGMRRLTLATAQRSTQSALAGLRSSVARSNRSNSKQFRYIREELDKLIINAPTIELIARVDQLEQTSDDQELQINQAMVRLDGAEAAILLKADQAAVNEQGSRLSAAEAEIDGANAAIALKADQSAVDAQGERLSSAEIAIDGLEADIKLVATQSSIDALVTRVSEAEVTIDGLEAQIKQVATQQSIKELEERVSTAEVDINGAKAAVALKADQSIVDELGEHLGQAEVDINAAEAAIALKASQESVTALENRVSAAEVEIDGANAAIALKASQKTVDSLGERVSAAEIAIDGANSRIDLKADLIALNGYVKASDFETLWLTVATGAYISTMNAGYIGASNIGVGDTLSAPKVTATNVNTAGLSATSISLGGTAVSSYDLTMGGLVAAKVFSGGNINLGHSHAVSVSDDGTVTLGEVSETGGNFKIADTKAYKDGVSAAIESVTLSADGWDGLTNTVRATNGKYLMVPLPEISIIGGDSFDADHKTTVHAKTPSSAAYLASLSVDASSVYTEGYNAGNSAGYNSGKSDWRPTIVARTAVDTTNKTVTVSVSNLSQTLLTGQVVSAVEVYDAGYNAGAGAGYNNGYSAGYAAAIASLAWSVSGTNVIATFGDGSTKALDVESYVSATADVKYVSSTSTTITVRGWAYAYFNKVNCASVYRSATYDTAD